MEPQLGGGGASKNLVNLLLDGGYSDLIPDHIKNLVEFLLGA